MQNDKAAWDKLYTALKAFKKTFGHCNVQMVVRNLRHAKPLDQIVQSAGRSNRYK
jgi:hypothetical protein